MQGGPLGKGSCRPRDPMAISSGPQYGSLERAWGAIMTEADKVSELHQEVKNNLLNEDLEKVKNWQKDAYHKQIMGGFKETKEAEDGFRKAQKPWAKKMKEVPSGRMLQMGRGWAAELRASLTRGRGSTDGVAVHCPLGLCHGGAGRIPRQGRHCRARQECVLGQQAVPCRETSTGGRCSQIPGARACLPPAS